MIFICFFSLRVLEFKFREFFVRGKESESHLVSSFQTTHKSRIRRSIVIRWQLPLLQISIIKGNNRLVHGEGRPQIEMGVSGRRRLCKCRGSQLEFRRHFELHKIMSSSLSLTKNCRISIESPPQLRMLP